MSGRPDDDRSFPTDSVRISARDVLSVLFRHRWAMLAFFAAVLALTTAYTFLAPEVYQSEAKLLLRLGRENLSVDPSVTAPTLGALSDRDSEGKTELAILTSRYLAERVVDALGEERLLGEGAPAGREAAVRQVTEGLSARADINTDIIELKYRARGAELAHATLGAVIEAYLERHIEVYSTQASPAFFERRTEQLEQEFARTQRALEAFRQENGITSFELQRESLVGQIDDLETQLHDASSAVEVSRVRIAALTEALEGNAETLELGRTPGTANDAAESLKQRLVDLRLEETALSARYQDDHRPLLELREQIRHVEDVLHRAQQLALERERAQLEVHEARRGFIARELNERRGRLAALAGSEETLARLQLDRELAESEYQQYRENLQRARISAALDVDKVSNVRVIQPATLPAGPIAPDKRLNLLLAVTVGVLGAVLGAFALEYASDTLKSAEEVERLLGIPVLASITKDEFDACLAAADRDAVPLGPA